ncbi:hypothetical protein V8B97DRAFT_913416 [Scleroderma yunnanense]
MHRISPLNNSTTTRNSRKEDHEQPTKKKQRDSGVLPSEPSEDPTGFIVTAPCLPGDFICVHIAGSASSLPLMHQPSLSICCSSGIIISSCPHLKAGTYSYSDLGHPTHPAVIIHSSVLSLHSATFPACQGQMHFNSVQSFCANTPYNTVTIYVYFPFVHALQALLTLGCVNEIAQSSHTVPTDWLSRSFPLTFHAIRSLL